MELAVLFLFFVLKALKRLLHDLQLDDFAWLKWGKFRFDFCLGAGFHSHDIIFFVDGFSPVQFPLLLGEIVVFIFLGNGNNSL